MLNEKHAMPILTNDGQFGKFNILDHLEKLEIVKETRSFIEIPCPICQAENFKINPQTGKYGSYSCECMQDPELRKDIVKKIAPFPRKEPFSYSKRPILASKSSQPSQPLPEICDKITIAQLETIPEDRPQPIAQGKNQKITYHYSSTQGVDRIQTPNADKAKGYDKTFRQWHLDNGGKRISKKGPMPWPLYREAEIINVQGCPLLVEGEECVEFLRELGLAATTFQGSNWSPQIMVEAFTRLKDAGVPGLIMIPDNDDTGKKKSETVLNASLEAQFPVIIVDITSLWPEVPEKGDVADWITWGQTNEMYSPDFIRRLEEEIHRAVNERERLAALLIKPQLTKGQQLKLEISAWQQETDIAEREVAKVEICCQYQISRRVFDAIAQSLDLDYSQAKHDKHQIGNFMGLPTKGTPILAPGIPAVGVTILAGLPGTGKTTLAYDLAGAVLMGDEFLGEVPTQKGSVLFLACDEPYAHVQDKFINRGIANVESHLGTIITNWTVREWDALESTVDEMRPSLVVVDSFNGIHEDDSFDENSAAASLTIKKLEKLSSRFSVPILVIHHINKSKENRGVNKLRGSSAIAASCSSILILEGTEGNYKTLSQPKIRGSEPINLTLEADFEFGRFKVVSGNLADDNTKSLAERLHDFFLRHPGSLFEMQELRDYFPNEDRKVLTNSLNRLVNRGHIIKRPSKVNLRSKVYGIDCTDNHPVNDLPLPPPIKPLKEFDDKLVETIDIEGIERVITTSSPLENLGITPVINDTIETSSNISNSNLVPSQPEPDIDVITVANVIQNETSSMVTEKVMTTETLIQSEFQLDVINFDPQQGGGVTKAENHQDVSAQEPQNCDNSVETATQIFEWKDVIHEMDSYIKQLGWTVEKARKYVQVTYGKKSRLKLTDEELLELLHYFRDLVWAKE